MIELLPCPFCWSTELDVMDEAEYPLRVECETCGCDGPCADTHEESVRLCAPNRPTQWGPDQFTAASGEDKRHDDQNTAPRGTRPQGVR